MSTNQRVNRRNFLKLTGALAGALGLGGAGAQTVLARTTPSGSPQNIPAQAGSAEEMDAMHAAGVKTFLDNAGKDKNFWGVPMSFTTDGDTKVFKLTCPEGNWEVAPGNVINAMMYN